MKHIRSTIPKLDGILAGSAEPVFRVLPQRVLEDMKRPNSESALVWNLIYPLAQPTLSLAGLLSLPCQWGTHWDTPPEDQLTPYYWGYALAGERFPGLDSLAGAAEGSDTRVEVDLFLMGKRHLVLVEAKHLSALGRCSRYQHGRCPEIHIPAHEPPSCIYWEHPGSRFSTHLEMGERPTEQSAAPPCNRHYQLARTLLLGVRLAAKHQLTLHLWLITPRGRWRSLEADWLDFCDRVRDGSMWRRLRSLSWEALARLPR